MEYLKQKVQSFACRFFPSEDQQKSVQVTRKDAYLNVLYKIITWEDPTLSWTVLLALHFLFWLIVQLQVRLYGVFFLGLLVLFVGDTYFERNGLVEQRTSSSEAILHVYDISVGLFGYLKALRKDSPSTFCGTMCIVFLVVSFIARNLSGYMVVYLMMLGIFFGPLGISKLPEEYVVGLKQTLQSIAGDDGILAEAELMPFLSEKSFGDRDADLESLLTDRTVDSATSSFISGITAMPSHLDVDDSVDGLQEDDFVPPSSRQSYTPFENSSDSDSDIRNMKFKPSHFNPDTSSSEEDASYARDLKFSDDVLDASAAAQPSIGGILTKIGESLVSNVIRSSTVQPRKKSESDSDFEMINSEELEQS